MIIPWVIPAGNGNPPILPLRFEIRTLEPDRKLLVSCRFSMKTADASAVGEQS